MSLPDRTNGKNVNPARPTPPATPERLECSPPETEPAAEPTLQPVNPIQAAPAGAHLDQQPTAEFNLPVTPAVIPLHQRPTGGGDSPTAAPHSPMRKLTSSRERWIKSESTRPAHSPLTNVLILDREQCSCYLVKSILLGHRFGVSIATTIEDAVAKMATGLFDIVFADVGDGAGPELDFIRGLNADLPALPVIALCREEGQALAGCLLTVKLRKPVRMAQVNDAARIAALQVAQAGPESRRRAPAQLKVRVESPAGPTLECLLTSVSLSGMMIESAGNSFADLQAFQEFFATLDRKAMRIDVDLEGHPPMQLTARRAFAETTPDLKLRQVGLSIRPAEAELAALRGIIAQVA